MKIKFKKLLAAFFVVLALAGCEKESDTIIDPVPNTLDYKVWKVVLPDTLLFSEQDSVVTVAVKVSSGQKIDGVFATVLNPIGEHFTRIELKDNGELANGDTTAADSVYSGKVVFSRKDISGDYDFSFSIVEKKEERTFAKATLFYFNNQENVPPVLSNLTMPDTVQIGEVFYFSVVATDLNGLADIKEVYYEIYNPSGQKLQNNQGISKFPLSDNGDTNITGDEKAGDGIYTQRLAIPKGQPTGKWKFEFTAIDRSDSLSNTITHFLEVK